MIDGPINREMFELYVKTQLAPTLRLGDVIILHNLSSHKCPTAAQAIRGVGAWFLFLPPYGPDLTPIEINRGHFSNAWRSPLIFAKLKALIRRAASRTYDDLWRVAEHVCDLFTEEECYNFFKAAGYETD